jgi:hypothetical protein
MNVSFHQDMHVTIWDWIKRWCIARDGAPEYFPQSPGDVLRELIQEIDTSEESLYPFVVDGGQEGWRGKYLFTFANEVCNVGQRLYDEELQVRFAWSTMKKVLEFYLHESINYINHINSLGMSANEINQKFELGLDLYNHSLTQEEFRDEIIWSRYITSRKAWKFHPATGRFDTTCESSPALWASWVREHLDDLLINMLDEMISDGSNTPTITLETEEQKKKNAALRKIQETLDEVQKDIGDGLFLQMMNLIKDNYVVGV